VPHFRGRTANFKVEVSSAAAEVEVEIEVGTPQEEHIVCKRMSNCALVASSRLLLTLSAPWEMGYQDRLSVEMQHLRRR
jgi:hypothetical protein